MNKNRTLKTAIKHIEQKMNLEYQIQQKKDKSVSKHIQIGNERLVRSEASKC